MDQKQLFKQMLEVNKSAFDNNFKALSLFQNISEKNMRCFLNNAGWIPEENRKMFNEWLNAFRKSHENLKTYADENYKKAMEYFAGLQSQKEPE